MGENRSKSETFKLSLMIIIIITPDLTKSLLALFPKVLKP